MNTFVILLLIFIAVITMGVFLYSLSYNLAVGQDTNSTTNETSGRTSDSKTSDIFEAIKRANEAKHNASVPLAPRPIQFDNEVDSPTTPYPQEGQITIGISAQDSNYDSVGWSGSVLYGDGDITSLQGVGRDLILVDCKPGQPYSVTFQKDSDDLGLMLIQILGYNATSSNKVSEVDGGSTEAAYGIVGLRGTC